MVVWALLFSQLALANYLCPGTESRSGQAMAMEMAPGEPCEGMASDTSQPALCFQHCTSAPQSSDAVKVPTLSLPAVVQVLLVPLTIDQARQDANAFAAAGEAQPAPEPIFLSTLRLRV